MEQNCRAILWDVGGTLVDFACSLPQATRGRLAACGVDHSRLSDARIEQTYAEFLSTEQQWLTIEHERAAETRWFEILLENEGLGLETIRELAARMPRYFGLYRLVTGMIQLLAELRERPVPMAIVSNWAPSLPEFLEHHGLSEYFDAIVYSAQNGILKPDPRIFQSALEALSVAPRQVLFIGDNPKLDIAPAKALGMRAIHFDPRRQYDSRDAADVPSLRGLIKTIFER